MPPPPHYQDPTVTIHHGDALDTLRTLPDASVDSVVTDPPYGLGFMGKEWDSAAALNSRPPSADEIDERFAQKYPRTGKGPAAVTFDGHAFQQWCELWAAECLRVLKPGGHLLAFGGTRTWHRLACAVEDAGFEVRDSIAWMYGSGFPKSLDVSKAIDKAAGAEREVVGLNPNGRNVEPLRFAGDNARPNLADNPPDITAPATDAARTWQGWGTALKPAHEPIVVARKPLTGTVAANVLAYGTGALNIDGCRVEGEKGWPDTKQYASGIAWGDNKGDAFTQDNSENPSKGLGRWPANVVLEESQAEALDAQSGESVSRQGTTAGASLGGKEGATARSGGRMEARNRDEGYLDTGGASRFFYVAKADASERIRLDGTAHPTVKPLALMRWLVRLVTPPGGTVLEPFAGSGTTVEACILEGFRCIAIEREADYLPLITQRINRRRDPVAAVRAQGGDVGLFDLLDDEEDPGA